MVIILIKTIKNKVVAFVTFKKYVVTLATTTTIKIINMKTNANTAITTENVVAIKTIGAKKTKRKKPKTVDHKTNAVAALTDCSVGNKKVANRLPYILLNA